jgi:hypothetical protein
MWRRMCRDSTLSFGPVLPAHHNAAGDDLPYALRITRFLIEARGTVVRSDLGVHNLVVDLVF